MTGDVIRLGDRRTTTTEAPRGPLVADTDALAERLATLLANKLRPSGPWRDAAGAATHLACGVSRVRKLTARRLLPVHRDGGRVLYHVDELDAFIRAGGAFTE